MRAALLLGAAVRCAYTRDVDGAGFLLVRCVHSPGAIRVLLVNKIIVPLRNQKKPEKPNPIRKR